MNITHDPSERLAIMVSPETHRRIKNLATNLNYGKDGMKGLLEDFSKKSAKEVVTFLK